MSIAIVMSWWENGKNKQMSPCFCQTQIGRVGAGRRYNFRLLAMRSRDKSNQDCFPIESLHLAGRSWCFPDRMALLSAKNIVKMAELKIIIIPVYTALYDTIHPYNSLYRHILYCISLYQSLQPYVTLYNPIPVYTGIYHIIQPHTSQCSSKRHYTAQYQFIWPYVTLYSPIPAYTTL